MIKICKFCGEKNFKQSFLYLKKPLKETDFGISKKNYKRSYASCKKCNHFYSISNIRLEDFYSKDYNSHTYGKRLFSTFKKIVNLPKRKSDNQLRISRVKNYLNSIRKKKMKKIKFIDIGSGTGVFPYVLKKEGYDCVALDPDLNVTSHLKRNLKLKTITGDFMKKKIKQKFDAITLNKVIEHVEDPINFLRKAKKILKPHGFIYLEVPDGQRAAKHGKYREEFFIEHLHVFSKKSVNFLAKKLQLKTKQIKRIREPSNKFSIFAFLEKK